MRLRDNNSKGKVTVTTYTMASFYRDSEEHCVTCDCPVCDGDGWVYYQTENDSDVRQDCPHCQGEGTLETYIYIEEIEENTEVEDTFTTEPYEDNYVDYRSGSASDMIQRDGDRSQVLSMLERNFSGKLEEIRKAQELEKKKAKVLDKQRKELRALTEDLYNLLGGGYDVASDDVIAKQNALLETIKVVNEEIKMLEA